MASSTPAQAAAAQSLVGGCGDTVRGTPGQSVGVLVAGLSVINLGQVPQSGSTTFDATSILRDLLGPVAPLCQLTAEALPLPELLGPVEAAAAPVLGAVQGAVGSLPVVPQQPAPGVPAAPAPAPANPPQVAAVPQAPAAPVFGPVLPPFSPFSLGRYHSSLPLYDYAALLVGRPATIGRLQTGMLNSNLFGTTTSPGSAAAQDPAANDVAAAGRASALPASGADRVALPVLVAVLMLAIVTAALIRSWLVVTRR
ncbi:MAG: hypothetical protein ACRDSL_20815 [Pseudonocardiaceae bacterium]